MASNTISSRTIPSTINQKAISYATSFDKAVFGSFSALASLKLTVVLFALAIFIVFVGTLGQATMGMWEVIDHYFRAWWTWVDFQVFFPRAWFPKWQDIPGGIPFPGGALIGLLMAINLLAAHAVRFKKQATGTRLWAGLGVILLGAVLTGLVIASGHNKEGLQGKPPFEWTALWTAVKFAVAGSWLATVMAAVALSRERGWPKVVRITFTVLAVLLGILTVWLFVAGENAYPADAGMRILWQLIQSGLAGVIMLAGCVMVFKRRGGIVLIHIGVALMMFGQFYVSKYDVEEQMTIEEGDVKNYATDVRQNELAIVLAEDENQEEFVVIPRSTLLESRRAVQRSSERHGHGQPGTTGLLNRFTHWLEDLVSLGQASPDVDKDGVIRHEHLPFDIQVLRYYKNSTLRSVKPGEANLATAGRGLELVAVPAKASTGAGGDSRIDLAAAYCKLLKKDGSGDLGVYLFSQLVSSNGYVDQVAVDAKTYDVSLRFQRNYKPYEIELHDVRKDDYLGTTTPRNYSSDIRLVDKQRGTDRTIHVWMNNPLRYAGETFYQSSYAGPPSVKVETTTLSVVTNSGWMIPYVSCMLVLIAMLWHFSMSLLRFLARRVAEAEMALEGASTKEAALAASAESRSRRKRKGRKRKSPAGSDAAAGFQVNSGGKSHLASVLVPLAVVLLFALCFVRTARSPRAEPGEMQIHEFGKIPVIVDGRVKPFDTLARNSLRVISNRESFKDESASRQPAIRWLLDLISGSENAEKHRVFRIDNLEVLDTLGLQRRKSHLYSVAELRKGIEEFERQVHQARSTDVEQLSTYQRKLIELDGRIRTYTRVGSAFQIPDLPPLPQSGDLEKDREAAMQKFRSFLQTLAAFERQLKDSHPPLAVPSNPSDEQETGEDWQPYATAWARAFFNSRVMGHEPAPALAALTSILVAYREGDAKTFNQEVAKYQQLLQREPPRQLLTKETITGNVMEGLFGTFYNFEAYFNHVSPFFFCWWPYIFAFVLACCAWLGWSRALNRASFWLIVFSLAIHTLALMARIYISGRPPVTNLYSSAVFIGWGAVILGVVLELLYRNGVGNVVAAVMGFASLLIAHNLAGDGDTFTVLVAVLDTQFWLATHVVTITLGYATTFLAGGLAVVYILRGWLTPSLTPVVRRELARMIYGTLCFAIFFSFVGTVLGGLWADDSWGRFWGWDPKENGALMIVLWNALVLHARWDGMVKDRGLAVLAVGGNVVTCWSWFAVNELGVGLHSYGFTEGVLPTLFLFWLSQAGIIGLGSLPKNLWWSFRRQPRDPRQPAEV